MTEARYVPPEEREKPDPARRRYFEEYMERPELARLGVTYGRFVELREAGEWNAWADEQLRGRGKVDNERPTDTDTRGV